MQIFYALDRDETLIWIKRPTQPPEAASSPHDLSLWPHVLISINSMILSQPELVSSSLKFPFGAKSIRKDNPGKGYYDQLRESLGIGVCDIKNLWTRFSPEDLIADFSVKPADFDHLLKNDASLASISEFVGSCLKPNTDDDPKTFIESVSGLTKEELDKLWQPSFNLVAMYVYGLVCRSFYGYFFRKNVLSSSDQAAAFSELLTMNQGLLLLFAHDKDYAKRGPNDSLAIINAYYEFCKKKNLQPPASEHFNQILVPRSALFKEINPVLQYFESDLRFLLSDVTIHTQAPKIGSGDNNRREPNLVILQGPPGTGKTRLARLRSHKLNVAVPRICQFHPSYSYEQFVEGIHPVAFVDGTYKYQPVDGPLMISWRKVTGSTVTTLCLRSSSSIHFPAGILPRYFGIGDTIEVFSTKNADKPFVVLSYAGFDTFQITENADSSAEESNQLLTVFIRGVQWGKNQSELLILDELNRASVSQVFGELLYALSLVDGEMSESERRNCPVRLQYSQEEFYWPDGLHIIATLNQADRSTEDLDQALQRRFEIQNVAPESEILTGTKIECLVALTPNEGTADSLVSWLSANAELKCSKLSDLMEGINQTLKNNPSVFDADKKLIGQGIFLKVARVTAKAATSNNLSANAAKDRFIAEMKASLISQLQAICSNNTTLVADILFEAINNHNLTIPQEIVQDVLDAVADDHALHEQFLPTHETAA